MFLNLRLSKTLKFQLFQISFKKHTQSRKFLNSIICKKVQMAGN